MSDALTDVLEAAGIPRPRPTRTVVERDGYRVVTPPPMTVEINVDVSRAVAALKRIADTMASAIAAFHALPKSARAHIALIANTDKGIYVGQIITSQRRRRHR